jgi:hypothetical protein
VQVFSERLWGRVHPGLYKKAVRFIKQTPLEEDTSDFLPFAEVISRIELFLREKKLKHWSVKVMDSTIAEFQISKQNNFLVKKNAKITENRLLSLLAHEVETHIYRLENGRNTPFALFERGTAGYLETEEGLASYNQVRVGVPLGEKVFWGAHRVIAAFLGKQMSFVDLFHYMKDTFDLPDESAWKSCLKAKRGLENTSQRIAFTKDAIYFSGKEKIEEFLAHNPKGMEQLYIGKITIQDLEILSKLKEPFASPKFLPTMTIASVITKRKVS